MTEQRPTESKENNVAIETWNGLDIQGKEFCSLHNGRELFLNATDYFPSRKLCDVHVDTLKTVMSTMLDKFKDIEGKIQELDKEWQQADDKTKMSGKVSRVKDYLEKAHAVGDFTPIFKNILEKESVLKELSDTQFSEKERIAAKAEALQSSEDWKSTTEAFKSLIDEWRAINPTDKNRTEKLWSRIEKARTHFYERKRQYQESMEQEMMQNLDLKLELCEKSEQLALSEEWKLTSDLYKELMDKWKIIGRVASAEKNDELWNRFIKARNTFFDRKRQNFEFIQNEQETNYGLKLALVEKAESLQDSQDWKATTQIMADIMEEWKGIGKVPYEKAEELWGRLQTSRDHFFTAKRNKADQIRVVMEDNYAQKCVLLKKAEELQYSTNWRDATEELTELMKEWKKIGSIPREYGDEIWTKFLAARQNFFNRKDADREKRKVRQLGQLNSRLQQTKQFLDKIQTELKEEEDKLVDFRHSLQNTLGDSPKELELRKHLEQLVEEIEKKLPGRREKIEEVNKQYEELLQRKTAGPQAPMD